MGLRLQLQLARRALSVPKGDDENVREMALLQWRQNDQKQKEEVMQKQEQEQDKDKVYEAALKVVEALDVDASMIRMPAHLALALVNLQRAVKQEPGVEEKLADTLARKCDELEAENKALKEKVENLEDELNDYKGADDVFSE